LIQKYISTTISYIYIVRNARGRLEDEKNLTRSARMTRMNVAQNGQGTLKKGKIIITTTHI
jgi:hypothetical protein